MAHFDEEKQNKQLDDLHKQEEEQLVATLAESKYGLPYVDLYRLGVDNEALRAISEKDSREMNVAPFKLFGKNIFIAVHSPSDELLRQLKDDMERKNLINSNAVYTYQHLEEILGITKRTLSSFVETKELKPIVFGNKYRFLGSEVLRFLEARMQNSLDYT
jgi:hypothetical protein